jgi:hypothetical protein
MKRVIVHIENLVLKGFRYEDRHAIAAVLQEELTRMLAAPESAQQVASLESVPSLKLGRVNLGAETKPHQVGIQTGRAVGRGLLK